MSNDKSVAVRIWKPSTCSSVGHAALQTFIGGPYGKGIYVSFFPRNFCNNNYDLSENPAPGKQNQCNRNDDHFHTRDQDDLMYGEEPTTYLFDYLDVAAINKKFSEYKERSIRHNAFLGSSILRTKNTKNCVGIVQDLLSHGGTINRFKSYAYLIFGLTLCTSGQFYAYNYHLDSSKSFLPFGFASAFAGIQLASHSNFFGSRSVASLSTLATFLTIKGFDAFGRKPVYQPLFNRYNLLFPALYCGISHFESVASSPSQLQRYVEDRGAKPVTTKTFTNDLMKHLILKTLPFLLILAVLEKKPNFGNQVSILDKLLLLGIDWAVFINKQVVSFEQYLTSSAKLSSRR